jgi:hypothetical protein
MARPGATHRAAAPPCTSGDPGPYRPAPPATFTGARACRNPGLLDDPVLASAFRPRIARGPQAPGRQPGHPGARPSSPATSGPPGRPGRAPVHPLRRDPRSAPPPGGRSPCGRHDGRGRQRTTAIQEDPVGGTEEECARIGPDEYALPCNYAIRLCLAQRQITAGSEAWVAAAGRVFTAGGTQLSGSLPVTDALNAGAVS